MVELYVLISISVWTPWRGPIPPNSLEKFQTMCQQKKGALRETWREGRLIDLTCTYTEMGD